MRVLVRDGAVWALTWVAAAAAVPLFVYILLRHRCQGEGEVKPMYSASYLPWMWNGRGGLNSSITRTTLPSNLPLDVNIHSKVRWHLHNSYKRNSLVIDSCIYATVMMLMGRDAYSYVSAYYVEDAFLPVMLIFIFFLPLIRLENLYKYLEASQCCLRQVRRRVVPVRGVCKEINWILMKC